LDRRERETTLAQIIAGATASRFERLSGVESNVGDIRRVVAAAAARRANGTRTILFVDEIHRFNKAQQDVLLPEVESGVVRLIGATTQNPFFSINSALVSRSQISQLRSAWRGGPLILIDRALADSERDLEQCASASTRTLPDSSPGSVMETRENV
jgi:putative ATPase